MGSYTYTIWITYLIAVWKYNIQLHYIYPSMAELWENCMWSAEWTSMYYVCMCVLLPVLHPYQHLWSAQLQTTVLSFGKANHSIMHFRHDVHYKHTYVHIRTQHKHWLRRQSSSYNSLHTCTLMSPNDREQDMSLPSIYSVVATIWR